MREEKTGKENRRGSMDGQTAGQLAEQTAWLLSELKRRRPPHRIKNTAAIAARVLRGKPFSYF